MTDKYPDSIEFDIDRDRLRRFLRIKWFASWVTGMAFFGGFIGLMTAAQLHDTYEHTSVQGHLALVAGGIGGGLICSSIVATVLYFLFSHWLAGVASSNLRVIVEGAFLRIVERGHTRTDRKLHFRSIVDYTTVEGPLMRRFGIMALQMTTTGGRNQPALQILGIKNCADVRDKLAEIDALRENG